MIWSRGRTFFFQEFMSGNFKKINPKRVALTLLLKKGAGLNNEL